jgi:hypothetical protein
MQALLYVAAALTALWGIAHLCATRGVVRGFGELTADNRRIITMEWIVEGAALVSMGALVAAVTAVGPGGGVGLPPVATAAYVVAIATLVVLAVVSLFTGFRVKFLPFRLCPVIFTVSAVLVALGAWA